MQLFDICYSSGIVVWEYKVEWGVGEENRYITEN